VRNLYKVLGVASSADDQRIKTVFRRRAKKVHPDLNPGNRRAEGRFIELMQAYEVLSDARNRAAYDAHLAERRSLSRRRLVHCAGLMMTSFMLTAGSAILALSMAGADVPFRETWQLAVAAMSPADAKAPQAAKDGGGWTARVAVAPASDSPVRPSDRAASDAKPQPRANTGIRPVLASTKASTGKSQQDAPDASGSRAKDPRQQVATVSKKAPSTVKRPEPPPSSSPEDAWPPAPPSDEPRYSLGASDLR
jgi:curved DNA-binding protein CbpA